VRHLNPDQSNARSPERAQRPCVFFLTLTYMEVGISDLCFWGRRYGRYAGTELGSVMGRILASHHLNSEIDLMTFNRGAQVSGCIRDAEWEKEKNPVAEKPVRPFSEHGCRESGSRMTLC
jgi:hypothetical protein